MLLPVCQGQLLFCPLLYSNLTGFSTDLHTLSPPFDRRQFFRSVRSARNADGAVFPICMETFCAFSTCGVLPSFSDCCSKGKMGLGMRAFAAFGGPWSYLDGRC